jgi:tetratricopeptide (TPR) repeat protein
MILRSLVGPKEDDMASKAIWAAAGLAALCIGGAGETQAASTILSNGLASFCSGFAQDGRDDAGSLQTCNLAIETEMLNRHDRAGTYVNRGVIHMRRKDYDEAQADFNRALKLEPKLGEAFVNRGAAFVAQRRYAEALAEIDRGLALGPDEPEKAYYNRALANEGLDDMKAAYLDYLKALELKPGWDRPQTELTRFTVVRQ